MKTYKIILSALVLVMAVSACKEDLADLNEDKKNPTEVSGEYLFSNAQNDLADQIANTNVNRNVWRLWAQYWTETQYPDESQYLIERRNVPGNVWQTMYRDVLQDLKRSKSLMASQPSLEAPEVRNNKIAIAEILMIFTYHRMVTIWGNIPYSQALNIDETTTPAYDDAQMIYEDLFLRLDNAIAQLAPNAASYAAGDYMYNGDVGLWKKFANSLKLKMAVFVADVPEMNPGQRATAAINDGVISSPDENAYFSYSATVPYTNPLYEDLVLSGRNDFVAANTIVDTMNVLKDPRRKYYFDENIPDTLFVNGDTIIFPIYVGGTYGASNSWANYSHVDERFFDPTLNHPFMTHTEVLFYRTEMAARGLTGGDPADLYNQAVTASINDWAAYQGETVPQDTIDAYLAGASYGSGSSWKETVGLQMWLAFYNRGYDGWSTWRRLDYPRMNIPPDLGYTMDDLPVRFFYPIVEQTANGASYSAAAAAIGGDVMTNKLFWDVE